MTPQEAAAVAAYARAGTKLASALKARLDAAPKAAAADEVEKAASALVEHGWITEAQKAQAVAALADPTTAVQTLANLAAVKAAKAADPRLASGEPTATKFASNGAPVHPDGESEADRTFRLRMSGYKKV